MANRKDLELALRIRTDLKQGQAALQAFGDTIEDVGAQADQTGAQLGRIGETAEQQAARLKAMVEASLRQQDAQDALAASTARSANAAQAANTAWQQQAAAQTAAMNRHHAAQSALEQQAAAERQATEQKAKAAAEAHKQDAALRKLLGSIDRTEKALSELDRQEQELTRHFRAGRLEADAYAGALAKIRARRDALTGVSSDAGRASREVAALTGSLRRMYAVLATGVAGYGAVSITRDVIQTNLAWQQTQFTMEAATGSAARAREELDYVREVSERLGLELLSTSQNYARLLAAAKESPGLGSQIQGIFEGVASAAAVLHLSASDVDSLLLALEQMVSKGKVQSQELVLQLGQRVPGAFALAAQALGTNTEQLSEWLAQGRIAADEFLPRFGRALQEAYGDRAQAAAQGLQGTLNRLRNEWTQLKIEAGEAGFIDTYIEAVRELQDVLRDPAVRQGLNDLIQGLGALINYSARAAGQTAGGVRWLAEEFAARRHGPAADDPVRIEDQIRDLVRKRAAFQQMLDDELDSGRGTQRRVDELVAEIQRYDQAIATAQQRLDAYYQSFTQPPTGGGGTPPAAPEPAPFKPLGAGDDKDAERLAKQNEEWVAQLEKEAATYGKGKAALREYELAQRQLSGALKERAEAAWATLDAAEKQKQADALAKQDAKLLGQLQLDYLRATGQGVEAAAAEIERKYGALQERLRARGDGAGADLVDQLIDIEKARAALDELGRELDRIFAEQSRREQTINAQQQTGLISELSARRQVLDLHKATAAEVEKLLPQMRELAAATGDPAAIERVKDLETRLGNMRMAANELTGALKTGFESGLESALVGLATFTMDLEEAGRAFVLEIANGMARLAAQHLAQMATDSLTKLFQGGADAAADTAAATAMSTAITTAASAGAGSMSAAITTAASAGSGTMGAGVTTGGATAAASMATSITTAGAIAAQQMFVAITTASAMSAGAGAAGGGIPLATGGHVTGPGTDTSDSIPAMLSNWEYVTRAAVVRQPGALDFLHDFNRRGMAALDDHARRVRHATGGLAGVPAPTAPTPRLGAAQLAEPSNAGSTTVQNAQNFILVDDPSRIADAAFNSRAGEERFVVMLSRDPAKYRSILGINY